MEVSIEILAHFRCGACNGWFTVGDPLCSTFNLFRCPSCGEGTIDRDTIKKAIEDKCNEPR